MSTANGRREGSPGSTKGFAGRFGNLYTIYLYMKTKDCQVPVDSNKLEVSGSVLSKNLLLFAQGLLASPFLPPRPCQHQTKPEPGNAVALVHRRNAENHSLGHVQLDVASLAREKEACRTSPSLSKICVASR